MFLNANNMLHSVSAASKAPVLWLLIALLIITAFLTGSVICEALIKLRKRYRVLRIIKLIDNADMLKLEDIIKNSNLTKLQKKIILGVADTKKLPEAMRTEAAQGLITEAEAHYTKIINYTELIVKIAPMAGLMGTLIPLGPGIMALGHGDMETLSESIITAFDTTVAGLISAGAATIISSIRKIWYKKYISDIEAIVECVLEKLTVQGEG